MFSRLRSSSPSRQQNGRHWERIVTLIPEFSARSDKALSVVGSAKVWHILVHRPSKAAGLLGVMLSGIYSVDARRVMCAICC